MIYWDASALLKLYVAEPDSPDFDLIANTEDPIVSSAIVSTEVLCALYRKEHAGDLRPGAAKTVFRKFLSDAQTGRIILIPFGDDVVTKAEHLVKLAIEQPRPVLIRTLDVIHVSSALVSKARALVATDARLREVAALVRLKVLP